MNTLFAVLFAVVFVLAPTVTWAQQSAVSLADAYVIESGDNLWELEYAYKRDPTKWRRLTSRECNPWLNEPGRIFERAGKTIVLIRPGEKLACLKEAGINPESFKGGGTGGPGGVDDTRQPSLPNLPIEPRYSAFDRFVLSDWGDILDFLLWVIVIMAIAAFLSLFLGRRWLDEPFDEPTEIPRMPEPVAASVDPVLAGGPAFVAPDAPRTPEVVEREFERIAGAAMARRSGGAPTLVRMNRVGPIERGFLSGYGEVAYADGMSRRLMLQRTRAFRALYEMPGGEREFLYSLAGCMNPVTYSGQMYRGFDWEPEPEATRVAVPAPAPATAPAVQVQLATTTQKVSLWVVVRCSADGTFSSAVSGVKLDEAGDIVRVVEVKLPVRLAVQIDGQGRLGAAALGVQIPETASAEAERATRA